MMMMTELMVSLILQAGQPAASPIKLDRDLAEDNNEAFSDKSLLDTLTTLDIGQSETNNFRKKQFVHSPLRLRLNTIAPYFFNKRPRI
ncbi:hypothetical protein PoB_003000000 [Plakobranchus ocellatus]|uniref:Uncharacterized protein n=1 Tax=Plakobranchus ocellatus TaxID=259542 RepID=A0AAV4A9M3_9GAST|nr:hypothetical protein PoB_003000000 [Plakobranchus ocellatus]